MPWPNRALLLLVLSGLLAAACARQEPPPGVVAESRPPEIAELYPSLDTVLRELDGAARVEFDEPISRPGDLRRELRASPAYRYEVSAGHHGVEIRPEGGWRPGAVYVLELRGTISDLLNNQREDPIRWRFSTGPPVTETRVTGTVWDRVTGEQLNEARAHFLPVEGDSIPYAAVPDSGGTFRLTAVPPGRYRAVGFVDRNRNLTLDRRLEPSDSVGFSLEGPTDQVSLQLVLVEPDTTPPVLGRVEARDSVTMRLTFDDYLSPTQSLETGAVTMRREGGDRDWPLEVIRVLTPADLEGEEATGEEGGAAPTEAAPRDTTPADTAAAAPDSAAAAPDTAEAAVGDGATGRAAADTTESPVERLPTRSLRLELAEPMVPDTYSVRVRGVENLRGLTGGGDTTFVYVRADTAPTPTRDTTAADSAAAADTSVVRDSAGRPRRGSPR